MASKNTNDPNYGLSQDDLTGARFDPAKGHTYTTSKSKDDHDIKYGTGEVRLSEDDLTRARYKQGSIARVDHPDLASQAQLARGQGGEGQGGAPESADISTSTDAATVNTNTRTAY